MKKKIMLLLGVVILLTGCTVTKYSKTVTVEKDAEGKIISTTVVEGITQPDRTAKAWPFKYLEE